MSTATELLTDEEQRLIPTDEDVAGYVEHGWYMSGKVFSDDEVDALVAACERYYAGHRDRRLPSRPPRLAYWEPSHGDVQRHNDYVHYESDEIAAFLRKPVIGAIAAALARAEEIRVWQSTLIYKPPRSDETTNIVPWHMDRHYWQPCTSDHMLTAFIPMHDCTEEMGTITMVDGSHRWQEIGGDDDTAQHFANRDRLELETLLRRNAEHNGTTVTKVPMNIPKGHMSFHHCRIYHGSGPNRSGAPRRAISLHLQDGGNEYREYRLSDRSVVEYNHDSLVRTAAGGGPDYADPEFCPVLWRT